MCDAEEGEEDNVNSTRKVGLEGKSKGSMRACGLVAAVLGDRREDADQAYRKCSQQTVCRVFETSEKYAHSHSESRWTQTQVSQEEKVLC